MNKYELVAFEDLLIHLESAKNTAAVIGGRYCCEPNYNKALIFQNLRDRLYTDIMMVRSHMNIEERSNDENCN